MARFASELRYVMTKDPLSLPMRSRLKVDELDRIIYKYIRDKVYQPSFIYCDILRAFVVDFIERKGYTMAIENVCRDMPVFHRNINGSGGGGDSGDWIDSIIVRPR